MSEDNIEVEIETYLEPQNNTAGTGLYKSTHALVTQCEMVEFRCITPFLDRPDVLARYNVRIEAPNDMPDLYSNGDETARGDLGNGRHWVESRDTTVKPSYLFAIIGGKFGMIEDNLVTGSGRNIPLRTYVENGDPERARYAQNALKEFLEWDEKTFDAEYSRSHYYTASLEKLVCSAMENPALNVFLENQINADPAISTDANYHRIKAVRAHEGSHHKSGNDVTVASPFYISLKEGLTVLREHMFMSDQTSEAFERINNVKYLRAQQFPEDDSPLAHPVLPREVESVDNCYSSTIYEKGAEILEMALVMMGREKYIAGVKDYFKTYNGQAVTLNELFGCLEKSSGLALREPSQFYQWYTQSGRPRVKAEGVYDAASQTYTLTVSQKNPATPDGQIKKPMLIPIKTGLVGKDGQPLPLTLDTDTDATPDAGQTDRVINLTKSQQTFVFKNVTAEPAFHSLLRNFSAPVDLDPGLSAAQLQQMMVHDKDDFNRWDAGQRLALAELVRLYDAYTQTGTMPAVSETHIQTIKALMGDRQADPAVVKLALTPPAASELEHAILESGRQVSPEAVSAVFSHLHKGVATALAREFSDLLTDLHLNRRPWDPDDYKGVGERSLKGLALNYLTDTGSQAALNVAKYIYFSADNMTDRESAILALRDHPSPERDEIMEDSLNRVKDDKMAVQNWFAWQAGANSPDIVERLKAVTESSYFDWKSPAHVRTLIGAFSGNKLTPEANPQFYSADGKGFAFLADSVIKMDKIHPMTASGYMVDSLCKWQNYEPETQKLMIAQLERIAAEPKLSVDTREKVLKSLPPDNPVRKAMLAPAVN